MISIPEVLEFKKLSSESTSTHLMKGTHMTTTSKVPSESYLYGLLRHNVTQRRKVEAELFTLKVRESWAKAIQAGLQLDREPYYEGDFDLVVFPQGRVCFGEEKLLEYLRTNRRNALGNLIGDDRLKELIEEELHEDFEKFGIELRWRTIENKIRGSSKVLELHFKSEDAPSSLDSQSVTSAGIEG